MKVLQRSETYSRAKILANESALGYIGYFAVRCSSSVFAFSKRFFLIETGPEGAINRELHVYLFRYERGQALLGVSMAKNGLEALGVWRIESLSGMDYIHT